MTFSPSPRLTPYIDDTDSHQSRKTGKEITQFFEYHRLHCGISITLGVSYSYRHASVAAGFHRNLKLTGETRAAACCHVVRCNERHCNMDTRKDEGEVICRDTIRRDRVEVDIEPDLAIEVH